MSIKLSLTDLIRKTPGVCGGDACVRNLRLPVWLLVEMRRAGVSDADILVQYEAMLAQADLDAAWAYAEQHPEEIASALAANEAV